MRQFRVGPCCNFSGLEIVYLLSDSPTETFGLLFQERIFLQMRSARLPIRRARSRSTGTALITAREMISTHASVRERSKCASIGRPEAMKMLDLIGTPKVLLRSNHRPNTRNGLSLESTG
jgi:hypothetical protein